MSARDFEDFLAFLINAITVSFLLIAAVDFVTGLVKLMERQKKATIVSPKQLNLFALSRTQSKPFLQMPAPWTLPLLDNSVSELTALPQKSDQRPQLPLLLLPQAMDIVVVQPALPTTTKPRLDELLAGVDLDTLQLRSARKIAKLLNISQKVNGRDQPLSFLRAQIKTKLQQPQELPPAAIDAVRELLAS